MDIKCLVVGNSGVGKTSLIKTYISGAFPDELDQAICESFHFSVPICDQSYTIELVDVPNEKAEYDDLRKLAYKGGDVIILWFSLDDPETKKDL